MRTVPVRPGVLGPLVAMMVAAASCTIERPSTVPRIDGNQPTSGEASDADEPRAAAIAPASPVDRSAVEPSRAEPAVAAPVVITDPSQRETAVGKNVIVVGILTRTKIPQVNGVDVGNDYTLADRRVRVEGVLRKHVVEATPDPNELPRAGRGPGVYYSAIDPETGSLARPEPE